MSDNAERLMAELSALPVAERAALAQFLIRSLDDEQEADPDWDEAWTAELNRRAAELRTGVATPIPADEVMRALREKFS